MLYFLYLNFREYVMDSSKSMTMFFVALIFAIATCAVVWYKVVHSAQTTVSQEGARVDSECAKNAHSVECKYLDAVK